MSEQKDNSGALFRNDRKNKDTDPDYKGQAVVGGQEFWLAAWINTAQKSGQKYMAIKLNPKDEQDQRTEHDQGKQFDPGDVPF